MVKNQNNEKEQNRLKKKIRILNDVFDGSVLLSGLVGGFTAIALLMAGAAALTSNLTMNAKAEEIYASEEYRIVAREGLSQLDKKLAAGEIDEKQYQEGVDALYSIPEVIKYAETANDEELTAFMESYNESKEMAETIMGKGVPIFGATTAVGAAGAALALKGLKKTRKEFEEAGGTFDVQQSFDK